MVKISELKSGHRAHFKNTLSLDVLYSIYSEYIVYSKYSIYVLVYTVDDLSIHLYIGVNFYTHFSKAPF